jgi:hypothetical protein
MGCIQTAGCPSGLISTQFYASLLTFRAACVLAGTGRLFFLCLSQLGNRRATFLTISCVEFNRGVNHGRLRGLGQQSP